MVVGYWLLVVIRGLDDWMIGGLGGWLFIILLFHIINFVLKNPNQNLTYFL